MVIRGNSRGNGKQLAYYLLDKKDNSRIWILDIDGQENPQVQDLHHALFDMSITAELTNGTKGLYHAQINPDDAASQRMTPEDWHKAADILGGHLGYDGQRRAIVMHEKKGRVHAHVVWERYDHDKGILKPDSFNFVAQDKARADMERMFRQQETPKRNKHRPELKAALTDLWNRTATGQEFVNAAQEEGYILAAGTPRHPFMVVDKEARSFDLVRQLKSVRIKEVRQRMKGIDLMHEKEAIEQAKRSGDKGQDRIIDNNTAPIKKQEKIREEKRQAFRESVDEVGGKQKTFDKKPFQENRADIFSKQPEQRSSPADLIKDSKDGSAAEKKEKTDQKSAQENKDDSARRRKEFLEQLHEAQEEMTGNRERGFERE